MFASFDIYYTQVGQDELGRSYPLESNCANWINKLSEMGYYHRAEDSLYMDRMGRETYTGEDYFVKPGDLIFFNLKDSQYVVSDHVGIVTDVTDKKIYTIQGNSNYSVLEKDYNVGDSTIVGFGQIPENPNYVDPTAKTEEQKEETPKKKSLLKKITSKIVGEDEEDANAGIALLSDYDNQNDGIALAANGQPTDMTDYIKSITTKKDNNGSWQTSSEFTEGERIRFDMHFEIPANVVTADSPSLVYQLPDGLLKAGTAMTGYVFDNGVPVGTYEIKDINGKDSIVITYDSNYADGTEISGNLFFVGECALGQGLEKKEYDFAGTNTHITVKTQEAPYDVHSEKHDSLSADGKTIHYEAVIGTNQGTDGAVIIKDNIYKGWDGEEAGPATYAGTVTVEKYDASGNLVQGSTTQKTVSGNKFEFEMPQLNAGESYKLKYDVNVNDAYANNDGSLSITNYVNGTLKGHPNTGSGTYTTTEVTKTKISKKGSYNQATGEMEWTITINNPKGLDLGGKEVDDLIKTSGITIINNPVVTDKNGNVVNGGSIQKNGNNFKYVFPSGTKSDTYYIKYRTTAPAQDNTQVQNGATYKGDGNKDFTASDSPTVHLRKFGTNKAFMYQWDDSNNPGNKRFKWQTILTLPNGKFPEEGYLYEDTIMDAIQNGETYEDSHWGQAGEIGYVIQNENFALKIIENGQERTLNWNQAQDYIDVQIKYYTEKGGKEIAAGSSEHVGYFTVEITPKKEFTGTSLSFQYNTTGTTDQFTEGRYTFQNDGAVGPQNNTPSTGVDLGTLEFTKTRQTAPDENGLVEWKAELKLPKSDFPAAGYTYEDTILDAVGENGESVAGSHYGTRSEIENKIQSTFNLRIGGEDKNWSQATASYVDIEIKYYDEKGGKEITNSTDPVHYFTVFVKPKPRVKFVGETCTFSYPTHVIQDNLTGGLYKYVNTGNVGSHESTASYNKRVAYSFQKSVYTGNAGEWDFEGNRTGYIYSSTDGVEVDYGEDGIITYRILLKVDADYSEDIIIKDILPEGTEYIANSARAARIAFNNAESEYFSTSQSGWEGESEQNYYPEEWYKYNTGSGEAKQINGSATASGNQLVINLNSGFANKDTYKQAIQNSGQAQYLGIYYQVKITDPAWSNPRFHKKAYVNDATWEGHGLGDSVETKVVRKIDELAKFAETEGVEITKPDGSKIFVTTGINYNVVINPAADNLDPESETLELVDTFNPGRGNAELELQSVVLYEYSDTAEDHMGQPVNLNRYKIHYDPKTYQLTVVIPDELACILRYTYDISSGNTAVDYDVSNRVSLQGAYSTENKVVVETQDSGADSTKPKITLNKVDKDNYNKKLAGVEFKVDYLDSNGQWKPYELHSTCVTDASGQIHFDHEDTVDNSGIQYIKLNQNVLYRFVETKNPVPGYAIDDTPHYFVWTDLTENPDSWYSNAKYNHGDVSEEEIQFFVYEGGNIYIENEYKAISVNKVWVDEDGTELDDHPSEITVQLWEAEHEKDTVSVTTKMVDTEGNVVKSLTNTMGKGSSYTLSGWWQPVMGDVSVVTADGGTVAYSLNDDANRQLVIDSVPWDLEITIQQGKEQVMQDTLVVQMADGTYATQYREWTPDCLYGVYLKNGTFVTQANGWHSNGSNKEKDSWISQFQKYQYDQHISVNVYDESASNPFQTYSVERKILSYTVSDDYTEVTNWPTEVNVYDPLANPPYQVYQVVTKPVPVVKPAGWSAANITANMSIPESDAEDVIGEKTLFDTVTLNSHNGWHYTWGVDEDSKKLNANCYYFIVETSIGGKDPGQTPYTVLYTNNNGILNGEIVVTNRIPRQEFDRIIVTKDWNIPRGTETPESIVFSVTRNDGVSIGNFTLTEDGIDATESKYQAASLGNWTAEITGLPKGDGDYTYTIEETYVGGNPANLSGYEVSYDGNGSKNITITNKKTIFYELPHTGGPGTKLITMLGILLMAVATSLMILKKHRKEEIW